MPFDLTTAKPVQDQTSTGFDLSTAKVLKPGDPGVISDPNTGLNPGLVNDLVYSLPDYARGMNQVATTALKGVSLAAAAPLVAIDKAFGTGLADKWFSMTTAPLDKINEYNAIRPNAGLTGKISHTVGGVVGTVMEAGLTGPASATQLQAATDLWPTIQGMITHGSGSMAVPSLSAAIESGQKVFDHTGDGQAAFNAAKAAYLTSTSMAIIPFSAGGGIAQRALAGTVAGLTVGDLNRQYSNSNMPADMQQPMTFEDALLNGIVGAGFGIMGPRGNPVYVKPKEVKDAATVLAEGDHAKAMDLTGTLTNIVEKTGLKPGQVVADAQTDPTVKQDLARPPVVPPEIKAPDLNTTPGTEHVPRDPTLSPVDKAVESRMADKLANNYDQAVQEYNNLPDTKGGKILNVDTAREISPDYSTSKDSRSVLSAAVHEPASWFVKKMYLDKLSKLPPNSTVVMTSGGTGAGKSTAIDNVDQVKQAEKAAALVYDTNMNTFDSANLKVQQALNAGANVHIVHVQRDPIEALVNGALPRAMRMGRTVKLNAHESTHIGSAQTIIQLAEHYKGDPRVKIDVLDNTNGKHKAKLATIDFVKGFNYNDVSGRLKDALGKELQNGKITQTIHDATLGQGPTLVSSSSGEGISPGVSARVGGGNRSADQSGGQARTSAEVAQGSQKGNGSEVDPALFPVQGKDSTAVTERGQTIQTKFAAVESNSLVTSHDNNLKPNPNFPADLQPRDRARAASEAQISRIANNINPELLAESPKASDGAPIVGQDKVVESGNARTIALRRAYETGQADAYRTWLIDNAERFGMDPAQISKMKDPILVRVGLGDYGRAEFARQANESSVAQMGVTEIARSDASTMPDLQGLVTHEDGTISIGPSMQFIRDFMRNVSPTEQGALMTADGTLSQAGVQRIRNAVFAKAYGDPEIVSMMAESTDGNVKNILGGMLRAAPDVARLNDLIDAGAREPLDISSDLTKAVRLFSQIRSSGSTVDQYLSQGSLIDTGVSPAIRNILIGLNENSRSGKRISEMIQGYVDAVDRLGNPKQGNMFDNPNPSEADLIGHAVEDLRASNAQPAQGDMLNQAPSQKLEPIPVVPAETVQPAPVVEPAPAPDSASPPISRRMDVTARNDFQTVVYPKAKEIAAKVGHVSVPMIQRNLKLDYAQGERIVKKMEADGLIGPRDINGRHELTDKLPKIVTQPKIKLADPQTIGQAAIDKVSQETGIPRKYVPIAREMMLKSALSGPEHNLNIASVMDNPYGTITTEKAPNHINYKYVDSPDDVKAVHARISEVFEKEISAARGKESWDQTRKKAEDVIKNSGLKPNGGDFANLAGRAMAWEAMAQKAAFDVAEAARNVRAKGREATSEDIKAQIVAIENLAFLHAVDQGNGAEIARALNARKAARQMSDLAKNTANLFAQYGHDPVELANMIDKIQTKEGMAKFAEGATKASTWEQVIEAWKAGLVSGPVTHMANIMGNTVFAFLRSPIDAVASTIGILRGAPVGERLSVYEPLARIAGLLQGTIDGSKIAAAMIAHEDAMVGKAESFRHAIPGKAGEIIRIPFRLLGAEDAIFKAMNESGETFTLATRQAISEGLNPSTREFRQRIVEIMQNPSPAQLQQISDAGRRFTFNADMGEKGHAVQVFVRKWHIEFMVPFIRTPGNIAKELIRMTPMAPFIKEWRDAISAGGIEGDRAMAEVMVGSAIMAVVFSSALNGNISGAGDPDPAKRAVAMAAGWQPYSIKIGGTWYNYQRLQPLGTLIGMAADIANVWEHMDAGESDQAPKMLSVAFGNAITSQTFLQGITNLINAISDPTRFGPNLIQSFASSAVPNFIAQPTSMYDPFVRETNSIVDRVQSRIPGLRQQLPARLDVFGEPIQSRERLGVITPMTESEISKDKVRMEAARLGVGVSKAPKSINLPAMNQMEIGKVALSPEQQHMFTQVSGQLAHQILTPIVDSPAWDQVPDMMKRTVFDKVFNKAREVARSQVIPPEQMSAEMQRIAADLTKELDKITPQSGTQNAK